MLEKTVKIKNLLEKKNAEKKQNNKNTKIAQGTKRLKKNDNNVQVGKRLEKQQ